MPSPAARERIGRLSEACEVLARLWTEETVTFRGMYYTLEEAQSEPKPLQKPRLPLGIASGGPRYGLRVVATHADVWLNASLAPEDPGDLTRLSQLSRRLDEHCADVGRDPATIRRAVQFRVPDRGDEILRAAERYARAGFSDLILMPIRVAPAGSRSRPGCCPRCARSAKQAVASAGRSPRWGGSGSRTGAPHC